MDFIIVGGGVIGMLTARELHAAGANVTLLERQALGQESSWAGGGILSPLNPWQVPDAITRLCSWSQAAYPQLAQELFSHTGIDPEWQPSGLLLRFGSERDAVLTWACENQIAHLSLDARDIGREEPQLAVGDDDTAALLSGIAHIRNPRLLAALKADLAERGIQILTQQSVQSFDVRHGRIYSVSTAKDRYHADAYVVAAGAWSGQFGRETGVTLDVGPVRGQMLVFKAVPGLLNHIVMEDGRYLIPRRDGRILAGSTLEYAGYDKSTTEEAGSTLQDFAYRMVPTLRAYSIERHWAGLRPGSPQGIPYIGIHPDISNLYFNCGHFRNGLVMGPASARLLADLMLGRPPVVEPLLYQVGQPLAG